MMILRLAALLAFPAGIAVAQTPGGTDPVPAQPSERYLVRDFGAIGDGTTKDTVAFQNALDACAVAGGGEVVVAAGTYLIGSVQLGRRTILRLEPGSVILGSPDADDYPMIDVRWEGRWQPGRRALIHAADVEHIGIIGPGRIEGNSVVAAPQNPRGVVVLEPVHCRDVRWEGFTVTQGGNWATHPTFCSDVVITGVTINGGRDGIDIDSCANVRIEDCTIDTGDDCISLKSGRGRNGARVGRPTENVTITGCTLTGRRWACIGIGSETSGGVRHVRIQHCTFTSFTHGIYLKTRIGRAGVTEDISAEDIDVLGGGFLRVNLVAGGNTNTADDPVAGPPGFPAARRLRFANIRLHDAAVVAEVTQVDRARPVEGLALVNILGTARRGITLQHVRDAELRDIGVTTTEGPLLATREVTGTGLGDAAPLQDHVTLWNGRNLSGWRVFRNDPAVDPATVWSATDGVLRLDTKASGYLATEQTFADYHLHVEWRWPADAAVNSNSGVMLHVHGPDVIWPLCFEAQLKNQNAGQVVGMGLDIPDAPLLNNRKRAPRLADPSEHPPGEWNVYEIYCRGDTIEVFVNGVRQNAVDKLPVAAGSIALQMEGFPIEFRNVWLESL